MVRIEPISELDLKLVNGGWDFANARRQDIAEHWRQVTAEKPFLWNGNVLLCNSAGVEEGVFKARFVEADYASFVAWRDWGVPDASVKSCFGVPAVFSSDGALLIGVMGPWTLNAGKAYPPSGSLEIRDVGAAGVIDILGSMHTELREETGLDLAHSTAGEMVAIFEGPRIAIARRHDFPHDFATMEQAFAAHRLTETEPELEAIEAIWQASQIDSRMPLYAQEIIRYFHR